MNRLAYLVAITTLLLCSTAWSGPHSLKINKVKDGDTILVSFKGKLEQLQLLGIDAPEDVPNPKLQRDMERTKQSQEQLLAIGKLATVHLSKLAAPGSSITVDANMETRDRYGRIPAVIKNANGRNLNAAMVEDGYAVVMGRYPFDAKLKTTMQQQQQQAINGKLGLWGSHAVTTKSWGGK